MKNLICPGNVDAAACQKQGIFGLVQHFQSPLQLSHMDGSIGFISPYIDGVRIFRASQLSHHVFGEIDENRAGSSGSGNIESFFYNAAQILPVLDGYAVFCDTSGNAHNIYFLKSIIADQMAGYLTGEADERDAVIVGGGQAGDQIGGAGAAGDQTDTDFSGGPGISVCLMNKSLFMPGQDDGNVFLFIQLIADVDGAGPGVAEENFHTLFLQGFYEKFIS